MSKNVIDNLTLDAIDAQRLGMSYGRYKALHPNTREANETRLPTVQKKRVARVYEYYCRSCGNKFTTTFAQRRYCGADCKAKQDGANYRARQSAKRGGEKKSAI